MAQAPKNGQLKAESVQDGPARSGRETQSRRTVGFKWETLTPRILLSLEYPNPEKPEHLFGEPTLQRTSLPLKSQALTPKPQTLNPKP